jgi:hypothetical protein
MWHGALGGSILRSERPMSSSRLSQVVKGDSTMENSSGVRNKGMRWLYILLIIPFIATLWIPFYAGTEPSLGGIPYFYWYQFLWVIITSIITAIVYFIVG